VPALLKFRGRSVCKSRLSQNSEYIGLRSRRGEVCSVPLNNEVWGQTNFEIDTCADVIFAHFNFSVSILYCLSF